MKKVLLAMGMLSLTLTVAHAQEDVTLGKGCPAWVPFEELVNTHKVNLTIPQDLEPISQDGHEHISKTPIVIKKGESSASGEVKFEIPSHSPIHMQFSFNAKSTQNRNYVIKERTFEVTGFEKNPASEGMFIHPASGKLSLKSKELDHIDLVVGSGDFIKNITMEDLILGFPVRDADGEPTFDEAGNPVLEKQMLKVTCEPKDPVVVLQQALSKKDCSL